MYQGDIRLGDTLDFKFTTRQASGAPTTLAGTPVLSCYVSNNTTEITAGITLTADFDSRTGLNHVRIVASSGNGYATASNYDVVITTGTVNSVSVVSEVIGSFSIENRSALMPTTAARTIAVDASGRALSDIDTIKTNAVVNGGTITFPTNATLASTTNITAGTITTVTTVTNQLTAAAIATGIWQDATAGDFTAANSIGKSIMNGVSLGTGLTVARVTLADTLTTYTGNTPQTGDNYAIVNGASGLVAIKTDTAAIKLKTDNLPALPASTTNITAAAGVVLSATGSAALTESYAADGATFTLNQAVYMIWSLLAERSRSSTTLTSGKLDGTSAMTFTLDSATAPSSQTRAT